MFKRFSFCFEMPRANIPFFPYWLFLIIDNGVEFSLIDDFLVYLWSIGSFYFLNLQPICKQTYILYGLPHTVSFALVKVNWLPASILQIFLFVVIKKQLGFYLLLLTQVRCCLLYQSLQGQWFLIRQSFAPKLINYQCCIAFLFFL